MQKNTCHWADILSIYAQSSCCCSCCFCSYRIVFLAFANFMTYANAGAVARKTYMRCAHGVCECVQNGGAYVRHRRNWFLTTIFYSQTPQGFCSSNKNKMNEIFIQYSRNRLFRSTYVIMAGRQEKRKEQKACSVILKANE